LFKSGFQFQYELDVSKLERLISKLIREKGTELYRYKGVLPIKGMPNKFVFQGVHMLMGGDKGRAWKPQEARESRLVFIGRDLPRDTIEKGLQQCLV